MSSIIINIPDCAKLGSSDPGERDPGKHDTITVYTENCPVTPHIEGPPPLIDWWVWLLAFLLAAAFIGSTAMVRYRRHERLEAERKAEVAAQAEMSKHRCQVCGADPKVGA